MNSRSSWVSSPCQENRPPFSSWALFEDEQRFCRWTNNRRARGPSILIVYPLSYCLQIPQTDLCFYACESRTTISEHIHLWFTTVEKVLVLSVVLTYGLYNFVKLKMVSFTVSTWNVTEDWAGDSKVGSFLPYLISVSSEVMLSHFCYKWLLNCLVFS